jgi:hypothetical protein
MLVASAQCVSPPLRVTLTTMFNRLLNLNVFSLVLVTLTLTMYDYAGACIPMHQHTSTDPGMSCHTRTDQHKIPQIHTCPTRGEGPDTW